MDKKYDFDAFVDRLVKALEEFYGDGSEIKVRKIPKNNGTKMTGICLALEGDTAGIVVYAEGLFEQYLDGKSFGEIVLTFVERVKQNRVANINMNFLLNYGKVRKRLGFKLLNRARNRTIMRECPYEPFLDLILVQCCFVQISDDNTGVIGINNSMLEKWEISKSQVFSDAWENSRKISRLNILSVQELMGIESEDMEDSGSKEILAKFFEPYNRHLAVTNTMKFYGASVMAFPENMEEICRRVGGDYYLLPSSVHEWIAVPTGGFMNASDYAATVREGNQIATKEHEILSYSVYYYDSKNKKLSIAYQG